MTYADPVAAARIRKKGKDYGQLEPITALSPLLGDKVSIVAIAGAKIGDVVVHAKTDSGGVFYASDFIANIPTMPTNPIAWLLFKLTDSGPGLKVFGIFFKFFVADGKAARSALIRELEANPPSVFVPAHGDVVSRADIGTTLVNMLRSA